MKCCFLIYAALFASASLSFSGEPLARDIHSNSDQELKIAALPKEARDRIAWLRPGLTRSQLEGYFTQDGGLSFPFHQRYYLRDLVIASKVVMIEIAYQPADIPKRIYDIRSEALKWARSHDYGDNKADIIRGVSTPFYAIPAID